MIPRLPETWRFDVHATLKHAPANLHNGIYLEVYPVANYHRACLRIDDAGTKRWAVGLWVHSDSEAEAIAAVEELAVKAGVVEPREVKNV
jgi:hypothetical protein